MHLRHAYSRGIGPLISLLDQQTAYLETQLVQSGIGLDGIGYQLALEAGLSERRARDERHSKRLQRIVAELPFAPIPDVNDWVQRSSDAYNGVKHADRDMPDRLIKANTLRENLLVFRFWVAGRIDVTAQSLEQNLRGDPMRHPYHLS